MRIRMGADLGQERHLLFDVQVRGVFEVAQLVVEGCRDAQIAEHRAGLAMLIAGVFILCIGIGLGIVLAL
eukprot:5741086-Heterocapsa_arctica.AAC.1